MIAIKRLHRADRKPDAVDRQRVALAQGAKLRMRRSAGAHVVLGVNLEKTDRLRGSNDLLEVPRLETNASARRQVRTAGHGTFMMGRICSAQASLSLWGLPRSRTFPSAHTSRHYSGNRRRPCRHK